VLTVLDEVGVRMEHRPGLEVMEAAGCRVDFQRRVVRIPERVLGKCLAMAPPAFTLYARVDQRNVYTIGGSSALNVVGLDGVRRPATLQDLADLTRLQDALPNLHVMHGIVNPQDIPQEGFDRILFSTVMANTRRNYYSQALGAQGVRDLEVNEDAIALDLIRRVGIGGNYLGEEHTARHFREVTWFPTLTNRQRWENWMAEGGTDMRQRGIQKARKILAEHRPRHLDPKMAEELERMARAMQAREIEAVRSGRVVY